MLVDAGERWIAVKNASNIVKITKKRYAHRIRRFARNIGGCVQNLDVSQINDYVRALVRNGGSRKAEQKVIAAFVRWCVTAKIIGADQVDLTTLEKYKIRNPARAIYAPQDLADIVHGCDVALVIPVVLVAFGALRPSEAARLQWEDVRWHERRIWVSEVVSKTGQERWAPICDTLFAFLAPWRGSKGPISLRNEEGNMVVLSKLVRELGKKYVQDILRHCYASYRVPISDVITVSEDMGNSPIIVKRHYQNRVVALADIPVYWAIAPCASNESGSNRWNESTWRSWMKARTASLWIELEERADKLPEQAAARAKRIEELTEEAAAFIDAAPYIVPKYS